MNATGVAEHSDAKHRVLAERIAVSMAAQDSAVCAMPAFWEWFRAQGKANPLEVERVPFAQLSGWSFEAGTGNLRHDSGRFFAIEGLQVRTDWEIGGEWMQPIINQPEIGILGILVREIDGVLHFLMQAKTEPGNIGGVQLSPTLQATRSNYLGVHQGRAVPFLEYFVTRNKANPLVDVLQSEQGAWFLRKRNRNMIVETTEAVPEHEDFRWLTLGQISRLLTEDNVINMDARTVLSCLPWQLPAETIRSGDGYTDALTRGLDGETGAMHSDQEILHWLTDIKSRHELAQRLVPLDDVAHWHRDEHTIAHTSGKYFRVIGANVLATNREVGSWTQPLLEPVGRGVAVFIARPIQGTLHLLVHAKMEAGVMDVAELAPSMQCLPENYLDLAESLQPRFLREAMESTLGKVRYGGVQSEEGGRFYHADNRYEIIEVGEEFPIETPAEYRWMTPGQIISLLMHSNYFNVQARSLMACLQASW